MNINFDEASKAWRLNKKYIGNGMFSYKCQYIHTNNKQCNKSSYLNNYNFCKKHLIYNKKHIINNIL